MSEKQIKWVKWLLPTLLVLTFTLMGSIGSILVKISPKIDKIDDNERAIDKLFSRAMYNEEANKIMMNAFTDVHPDETDPKQDLYDWQRSQLNFRGK